MSTGVEQQNPRERSVLYVVVSVVLVVLAVWAVIAFASARESQQAEERAEELVQALEDAGATATPQPEVIARVLGDDGGAVCANPNQALSRATLFSLLTNGTSGPGARPVLVDNAVFRGQLAIIEVYCPDELDDFQQFVDSLETTDSANG
jgi:Tfp pilus assembly protein FimT